MSRRESTIMDFDLNDAEDVEFEHVDDDYLTLEDGGEDKVVPTED